MQPKAEPQEQGPPQTGPPQRSKAKRRSRDELRSMMLDAGCDVLFGLNSTLGFEGLTYSTVFAHLLDEHDQKVTIGSVHERIWSSQREFQLDVVARALYDPISGALCHTKELVEHALLTTDLSSPARRRHAAQTVARTSSRQNIVFSEPELIRLVHAVRFRLWEMGPDHPEAAGFFETIREIREQSVQAYIDLITISINKIGLRVRPEAGDADRAIRDIALIGNGSQLGLQTDPLPEARTKRFLPTGLNGETEEWYPDGIALWSVIRSTFELANDDLSPVERRL